MQKSLAFAAAIAIGAALAAAPALAQKAINDGGVPPEPAASAKSGAAPTVTSAKPYYGKGVDDGGIPPEPTAAEQRAAGTQNRVLAHQPTGGAIGRNPNDGGMTQ